MMRFAKSRPYLFQFVLSFAVSLVLAVFQLLYHLSLSGDVRAINDEEFAGLLFWGPFLFIVFSLFCVYPVVLLGYQLILFVRALRWETPQSHRPGYDSWALGFLLVCSVLYLSFSKQVMFLAGWQEQLKNSERHSPISPSYYPWIFLLVLLFLFAFYVLSLKPVDKLPPLIPVLAIGVLYIATVYVVLWTIQIFEYASLIDLYMLIPVVVFVLIVSRTLAITVRTHKLDVDRSVKIETHPILAKLNSYFARARTWPVLGFLIALPVMGVVYAILLLLGQGPHALIRAFTDTSEWTLSQQISPPNVFYDEHYLCTVAAGGHKKLVKPMRGGIRHGHPVIVNRQLLVANAFEQVISDRLPRTHRAIRHFYDRYGFDLAKRIRTKWVADIVWVLMKPLEWGFLSVIYLCVRHPEDLIAMQYTGIHYHELSDLDG
ncbi:DUF6688 domain-containing protein [Arcanobacterium phocae]|uniref:DUF6688 domain-containing protein n=1 Tax=Arcanobacterium phocae TaxID=131112 RepID=UPI001C0E95D8|nr:DUF6688 family protein [Arcanobacterium phocae]